MAAVLSMSALTPLVIPRRLKNTLDGATVEAGPTPYNMARGYLTLYVKDNSTGYTFSFDIQGGYTPVLTMTNSNFYILQDTAFGCTVQFDSTNNYTVTTPLADSGGRTYTFVFYNYYSLKPTIQKSTGTTLATTITVVSRDAVWTPAETIL